jgi:hypothetical protein
MRLDQDVQLLGLSLPFYRARRPPLGPHPVSTPVLVAASAATLPYAYIFLFIPRSLIPSAPCQSNHGDLCWSISGLNDR